MPAIYRLAVTLVTGLVVVAFASAVLAQESRIQVQSASAESWPSVEVTLTAFDEDGQPYAGLTAKDLTASVNGESAPVSSLRTTSDPGLGIAVVLAFDVSGSMAGPPLAQAKAAGKALVGQLGPDDQAAVVAFGSQVTVRQSFTSDRAALEGAIDALAIAGDTALYGGVQASAQLVSESSLARRAIVLLSDGFDFGGLSTVDRAGSISLVRESGALTFTVGLGAAVDQAYLGEVAAAGQGQFLLAPQPADLTSAYLAAGDVLRQQYVLTLDASAIRAESADSVLEIEARLGDQVVTASTALILPAAALTPPEDVEPPADEPDVEVPEPEPEPAAEPILQPGEDSGNTPWLGIAGLAAVLLLGVGAVSLVRRRRGLELAPQPLAGDEPDALDRVDREPPEPVFPEIVRAAVPNGATAWLEGPESGRVMLTGAPVTVGVTPDCDIRLSEGPAQARLRIWRREGSYMVHNLSQPLSSVTIGGRPVSWAILEDGDEIVVGSATLSFHDSAAPA